MFAAMELGTVTIGDDSQALRATLVGEFDLANAPAAEQQILAALGDQAELVVDLRGVTFMDSTMLHALVHLREAINKRHGTMTIEAGALAERTLRVAGLDDVFEIRAVSRD